MTEQRAIAALQSAAQRRDWQAALKAAQDLAANAVQGDLEPLPLERVLAPVPAPEYHVRDLDAAPGRPSSIVGMGYGYKTLSMQAMALATAAGCDVWEVFPCRQGRVAWLDYEMGPRPTLRRMRRLAGGMGVRWEDVAPSLSIVSLPKLYLNAAGFEDALTRCVDGCTAAFVDSLRRAMPGADENSSEVAQYLDVLMRVSERTGVVIWFIHHATTKSKATEGQDVRGSGRGSSAIFDGSGSVLNFSGKRGEPTLVQQIRTCEGASLVPDFQIHAEDVEGGLRIYASALPDKVDDTAGMFAGIVEQVRTIIATNPGIGKAELRRLVGVKAGFVDAAVERLERTRIICVDKVGKAGKQEHRING